MDKMYKWYVLASQKNKKYKSAVVYATITDNSQKTKYQLPSVIVVTNDDETHSYRKLKFS